MKTLAAQLGDLEKLHRAIRAFIPIDEVERDTRANLLTLIEIRRRELLRDVVKALFLEDARGRMGRVKIAFRGIVNAS